MQAKAAEMRAQNKKLKEVFVAKGGDTRGDAAIRLDI